MADGTGTDTQLVTLPKGDALRVFTSPDAIDPLLVPIRKAIDAFVPDVSTKRGREEIARIAYRVARSKTYLDGIGKDLADEQKAIPKKIDEARKKLRDTLDAWKDEVRKPLTEWEAAEKARLDAIEVALDELREAATDRERRTASEFAAKLEHVRAIAITPERYGEAVPDAADLKGRAIVHLEAMLDDACRREEEAAELERFRREKAARDDEERVAKAAAAAVAAERAKAEADAARHERELREAVEAANRKAAEEVAAAERRTAEAVEQAQREVERQAARSAAERQQREQDREHRARVNRSARDALMASGIDEATAVAVVRLIASGAVPAVSITY